MKDECILPSIVAHRGASAHAPENTAAAIRLAAESGADGVEFDVRLAKDGRAVIFHDADLNRIAAIDRRVADLTSRELARIDAGSWFNRVNRAAARPDYARERIPTLASTADLLGGFKGPIYIELKCREREIDELADAVVGYISNADFAERVVVKSFRLGVIAAVKRLDPAIRTAALFAPKVMTIFRKEKYLVKIADDLGADEISIHYSLATRKLMKKAEQRSLPVAVWTIDNARWLARASRLGVRTVITNDPARLIAARGELQEKILHGG